MLRSNLVPPTPTDPYARRWHALLVENIAIPNEHAELTSSFTRPFSAQQKVQLNANAGRRQKLSLKLHDPSMNGWLMPMGVLRCPERFRCCKCRRREVSSNEER
jgi:hypothetical protein